MYMFFLMIFKDFMISSHIYIYIYITSKRLNRGQGVGLGYIHAQVSWRLNLWISTCICRQYSDHLLELLKLWSVLSHDYLCLGRCRVGRISWPRWSTGKSNTTPKGSLLGHKKSSSAHFRWSSTPYKIFGCK